MRNLYPGRARLGEKTISRVAAGDLAGGALHDPALRDDAHEARRDTQGRDNEAPNLLLEFAGFRLVEFARHFRDHGDALRTKFLVVHAESDNAPRLNPPDLRSDRFDIFRENILTCD